MREQTFDLPADLPSLPKSWNWYPLEALIDPNRSISYGVVQPGTDVPFGVPIIRVNNIRDNRLWLDDVKRISPEIEQSYTRTRLQGGEVLLTLVGSIGESAVVPDDVAGWNLARAVGIIPVSQTIDPKWIVYCLRLPLIQSYMSNWANTTVQVTLNLRDVARLPIPMPPEQERVEIVQILGALDDKIELNRRMNATLEATARALFQSWFVDFDPVHAKAEGRQPEGMDAETAALFPDSFEESPLGMIPRGWRVESLGESVSLQKGLSYKGASLSDSGTPMINLGCFLGDGQFSRSNLKFYTGDYKPRHLVKPGDIVLANTDMTQKRVVLGSPAIVPDYKGYQYFLITHHVSTVRFSKEERAWHLFIYYNLLKPSFRERVIGFATGTTVLALPTDALLGLPILVPSSEVTHLFSSTIQPMLDAQNDNEIQSESLAETRDALLPKLISGEVRVGDNV